jgi:amino acid transporter
MPSSARHIRYRVEPPGSRSWPSAGTALNGKGIGWRALFMIVFTLINLLGVRWLAETNSVAVYWNLAIPAITIFALIFTSFHTSNFTAGGSFMPYGFHGVLAALALGVIICAAYQFPGLAVFYWASFSGMSPVKVREAVGEVESEASVELETPLT